MGTDGPPPSAAAGRGAAAAAAAPPRPAVSCGYEYYTAVFVCVCVCVCVCVLCITNTILFSEYTTCYISIISLHSQQDVEHHPAAPNYIYIILNIQYIIVYIAIISCTHSRM